MNIDDELDEPLVIKDLTKSDRKFKLLVIFNFSKWNLPASQDRHAQKSKSKLAPSVTPGVDCTPVKLQNGKFE
jgi:hypothetical protein